MKGDLSRSISGSQQRSSQTNGLANVDSYNNECSVQGEETPTILSPTTLVNVDSERGEMPKALSNEDLTEVWWETPAEADPENPRSWSGLRKWRTIIVLVVLALITPLASSMFAPGVPAVMKEFGSSSRTLATFVVSVYLLGFASGPLLMAPLSEIYGRYWIYATCNIVFVVFAIACAVSQNINQLIVFRFFLGVMGATPLTIGGGTIADLMPVENRGGAMAVYALGVLLGPSIGPVAGGYLVQALGWRWVFWLLAILSGGSTVACLLLMRETYAPVLLERKAKRLRKQTGNNMLRSRLAPDMAKKDVFLRAIVRPSKMLMFSPIVMAVCVYVAVAHGILYLLFTTFTFVFRRSYRFSTGTVGLTFLPLGIGMISALFVTGKVSDRIIRRKQLCGETVVPEDRIPIRVVVPAALCLPAGLFIYGWTTQNGVHWIVPLIGTAIIGFGLLAIFVAMQTYLVDAFVDYAASAMAANTVLSSLLGGVLPLCGLNMYDALGLGWGNSLLGFIALVMVPIPTLFAFYGERIRNSPRFQVRL